MSVRLDPNEVLAVELDREERKVLLWALVDWGGPAHCTDEMAVAMGFEDADDLLVQARRLYEQLHAGEPLSRLDWLRTLLSAEVCFICSTIGSGLDWPITSGVSDEQTIRVLRSVQRKFMPEVYVLVGTVLGTRDHHGYHTDITEE